MPDHELSLLNLMLLDDFRELHKLYAKNKN